MRGSRCLSALRSENEGAIAAHLLGEANVQVALGDAGQLDVADLHVLHLDTVKLERSAIILESTVAGGEA